MYPTVKYSLCFNVSNRRREHRTGGRFPQPQLQYSALLHAAISTAMRAKANNLSPNLNFCSMFSLQSYNFFILLHNNSAKIFSKNSYYGKFSSRIQGVRHERQRS